MNISTKLSPDASNNKGETLTQQLGAKRGQSRSEQVKHHKNKYHVGNAHKVGFMRTKSIRSLDCAIALADKVSSPLDRAGFGVNPGMAVRRRHTSF